MDTGIKKLRIVWRSHKTMEMCADNYNRSAKLQKDDVFMENLEVLCINISTNYSRNLVITVRFYALAVKLNPEISTKGNFCKICFAPFYKHHPCRHRNPPPAPPQLPPPPPTPN